MTVDLGGVDLVLAGTSATVGDDLVELSDTEARLLWTLAAHPDVVVTKADLLRDVWGEDSPDAHVVEVTVARLRRRLGAHGTAVASVHRRGYALRTGLRSS